MTTPRVPFVRVPLRRLDDGVLTFPEAAERVARREAITLRAVALEDRLIFQRFERERSGLFALYDRFGFGVDEKGRAADERMGPLTLSLINADDRAPALEHFHDRMLAVYAGFCPELESFVTLNLWPGVSETATIVFLEIERLAARSAALLELTGRWQLEPPNGIFPWRAAHTGAVDGRSRFYDWRFFPYAKRSGHDATRPPSPSAVRRLHLRDLRGSVVARYGDLVTVAGTYAGVRGDGAYLTLPRLGTSPWQVRVQLADVTPAQTAQRAGALAHGTPVAALLLRGHRGDCTLLDIDETSDVGLVAHLVSDALDARAVWAAGLDLGPQAEMAELYRRALRAVAPALRSPGSLVESPQALALLFASYLDPFFCVVGDRVLTRPLLLQVFTERELAELSAVLARGGYPLPHGLDVIALRREVRRLLEPR